MSPLVFTYIKFFVYAIVAIIIVVLTVQFIKEIAFAFNELFRLSNMGVKLIMLVVAGLFIALFAHVIYYNATLM